jgi:membrane-bound metal-dependent hydrolase YbcI (DUF457 family)
MDAFTHGLASYSITRAAFPKASRWTVTAAILAGMTANIDQLSAYAGPSAFFEWYRTATHSVVGTLAIVAVFTAAVFLLSGQKANADSWRIVFLSLICVCFLHVAMDLTQNQSVQLLWPFRVQRYSADWVADFDLWILLILLAGALLPQLLALVTEEIGAKSKSPRGRTGAIIALLSVCIYIAGRCILHSDAIAPMEARSYRGELPRRIGAFAEPDSPFHWHAIVETERALHDFDFGVSFPASFNPDAGTVYYKPEPSAALDAARSTDSVRRFLAIAKFPKATVEKTTTGYRVQVRDLAERRESHMGRLVIAIVESDPSGKVLTDELAWDRK